MSPVLAIRNTRTLEYRLLGGCVSVLPGSKLLDHALALCATLQDLPACSHQPPSLLIHTSSVLGFRFLYTGSMLSRVTGERKDDREKGVLPTPFLESVRSQKDLLPFHLPH